LKWIKEDEDLKRLPVVLQTGQDDARSVREGLAAGAYYYLSKPPEPALLLAVVRGALKQERESALLQETLAETVRALRFLQEATFRFQTVAEARTLAQSLAWASPDPARMVLGLQELLINAVEHGNYGISYAAKSRLMVEDRWHQELARLAMDSVYGQRAVTVHLSRTASQLSLTIRDEGAGFDWTDYLDFSAERAFDLHGRGIAMARMTSFDFLEYQGNGNTVVAKVNVPAAAARSHADLEC
jgi:anti-sigma regulatory factor (Ser/Thr protein kinase)